jgi:hypothetical protein
LLLILKLNLRNAERKQNHLNGCSGGDVLLFRLDFYGNPLKIEGNFTRLALL